MLHRDAQRPLHVSLQRMHPFGPHEPAHHRARTLADSALEAVNDHTLDRNLWS